MSNARLRFKDENGNHYPIVRPAISLEEAGVFERGGTLSKSDISEDGTHKALLYGELYTRYLTKAEKGFKRTSATAKGKVGHKGDILLPTSGETVEAIARACVVCEEGILYGSDLIIYRANKEILDPIYLTYKLNSTAVRKEVSKKAQGHTVAHTSKNTWKDISFPLPSLPEQEKIAAFLSALDDRITLQERKLELLKQQKQGYLQRIFNQTLRFKDENGDWYPEWETKKLGEVVICLDNKRKPLSGSQRNLIPGVIPYYGANNIQGYIDKWIFDEELVLLAEDAFPFEEYKTRSLTQYVIGKSWVNNHAHVLKGISGLLDTKFLHFLLSHKDITQYVNSGGRSKLTKSSMLTIPLNIPSLPEQERIATFVSTLDENVQKEEAKLKLLNKSKTGYLTSCL